MFKSLYVNFMIGVLGFFISFLFSLSTNGFITSMYRGFLAFFVFFCLTFLLKSLMKFATTDKQSTAPQEYIPPFGEISDTNKQQQEESFSDDNFKHLASIIKDQLNDK
ncbi:MAG: hypothetical protein K0S51_680 [Bacillales bacterium]|nr:hypothetical protein [Bacillales bacterium]